MEELAKIPALLDAITLEELEHEKRIEFRRLHLQPLSKEQVNRMADFNPTVWGEYRGMGL